MKNMVILALICSAIIAVNCNAEEKVLAKETFLAITTDKNDAIYKCGEKAEFLITVEESGRPVREGNISVSLAGDGEKVISKQSLGVSNNPVIVTGTLKEPGFLRCNVSYIRNQTNYASAAAAFEPARIKTAAVMPDDFDAFWAEGQAELTKIPLDIKLSPLPKYSNERQKCYPNKFCKCRKYTDVWVFEFTAGNESPLSRICDHTASRKKSQRSRSLRLGGAGRVGASHGRS